MPDKSTKFLLKAKGISFFSDIIKGFRRNPNDVGKKKTGLKVYMLFDAVQSVPTVRNNIFFKSLELISQSMIVFDESYNFYYQYALCTEQQVYFVTMLKSNATYMHLALLELCI